MNHGERPTSLRPADTEFWGSVAAPGTGQQYGGGNGAEYCPFHVNSSDWRDIFAPADDSVMPPYAQFLNEQQQQQQQQHAALVPGGVGQNGFTAGPWGQYDSDDAGYRTAMPRIPSWPAHGQANGTSMLQAAHADAPLARRSSSADLQVLGQQSVQDAAQHTGLLSASAGGADISKSKRRFFGRSKSAKQVSGSGPADAALKGAATPSADPKAIVVADVPKPAKAKGSKREASADGDAAATVSAGKDADKPAGRWWPFSSHNSKAATDKAATGKLGSKLMDSSPAVSGPLLVAQAADTSQPVAANAVPVKALDLRLALQADAPHLGSPVAPGCLSLFGMSSAQKKKYEEANDLVPELSNGTGQSSDRSPNSKHTATFLPHSSAESYPGMRHRKTRSSDGVTGSANSMSSLDVSQASSRNASFTEGSAPAHAAAHSSSEFKHSVSPPLQGHVVDATIAAPAGAVEGSTGAESATTVPAAQSAVGLISWRGRKKAPKEAALTVFTPTSPPAGPGYISPFAKVASSGDLAGAAAASKEEEEAVLATAEATGKKGHKRNRSLSSLLPVMHKSKPRRSASVVGTEEDKAAEKQPPSPKTPRAPPSRSNSVRTPKTPRTPRIGSADGSKDPLLRPKTPEPAKPAAAASALACFGMGKTVDGELSATDEEEVEALPAGSVGLRNLGNTCFINAALQCLRSTPGLPLLLVPDLLDATMAPSISSSSSNGSSAQQPSAGGASRAPSARASFELAPIAATAAAAPATAPQAAAQAAEQAVPSATTQLPADQADAGLQLPAGTAVAAAMADVPSHGSGVTVAPSTQQPNIGISSTMSSTLPSPVDAAASRQAAADASSSHAPTLPPVRENSVLSTDASSIPSSLQPQLADLSVLASSPPSTMGVDAFAPLTPSSAASRLQQQLSPSPVSATAEELHPNVTAAFEQAVGTLGSLVGPAAPPLAAGDAGGAGAATDSSPGLRAVKQGGLHASEQPSEPAGGMGAVVHDPAGLSAAETARTVSTHAVLGSAVLPGSSQQQAEPAAGPTGVGASALCDAVAQLSISADAGSTPAAATDAANAHSGAQVSGPTAESGEVNAGDAEKGPEGTVQEVAQGQAAAQGAQPLPNTLRALLAGASDVPYEKGMMADAFRQLIYEMYRGKEGSVVDPLFLLRRMASLPLGAALCNGGQHDCQEVLRLFLDSLHDDLNRVVQKPAYEEDKDDPEEAEPAKADRLWQRYLAYDNSLITDLFGGQLQSSVTCHACQGRFTMYEPFWDLSLPLAREGKPGGGLVTWFKGTATSIQDCLQVFTADELLEGSESFYCKACKEHTSATKHMRIHRLPRILLLHIKRFKYVGNTREKLTANVTFPLKGLALQQFVSEEMLEAEAAKEYDLFAVSNHFGNLVGGHYTATCLLPQPGGKQKWWTFNDDGVSKTTSQSVANSCAYMLFYCRRD